MKKENIELIKIVEIMDTIAKKTCDYKAQKEWLFHYKTCNMIFYPK